MKDYKFEIKGNALPWDRVLEVINYVKPGSAESIMFKTLLYTGCRISELDNMQPQNIVQNHLYWKTGKNQTGYRMEKMPIEWMEELLLYRKRYKCSMSKLFHQKGRTFVEKFDRFIRPNLSAEWRWKRLVLTNKGFAPENVYRIKCLRKNYQTLKFNDKFREYKDGNVAIEFMSKAMRHSSKGLTVYHYVENAESLELAKFEVLEIDHILKKKKNEVLLKYFKQDAAIVA
jgi:integrase